jgi:hypothetical protein
MWQVAAIGGAAFTGAVLLSRKSAGVLLAIAGFTLFAWANHNVWMAGPHAFRQMFTRIMSSRGKIESFEETADPILVRREGSCRGGFYSAPAPLIVHL